MKNFKKLIDLRRKEEIKEIKSLTLKDRIRLTEKLLRETPFCVPKIKDRDSPVALSILLKKKKKNAK